MADPPMTARARKAADKRGGSGGGRGKSGRRRRLTTIQALEPPIQAATRRHVRFLREFLANPGTVGAVVPSSRHLAQRMIEGVRFDRAKVVVEYGPGTGSFTGHIARRLAPGTTFFAVELSPRMAREWRKRYPGLRIHRASVGDMPPLCPADGVGKVDVIF